MPPPSPARLYAAAAGAGLIVIGLGGFFFDLSWLNFFHVAAGALGLVLASAAPRPFALASGLAFLALAAWGFADAAAGMAWLHLGLGLLGLAAFAGTPKPVRGSRPTHTVKKEPRKRATSETRAQAGAESA